MEHLIRQTRGRVSGGAGEETREVRDRRVSPTKTRSFKEKRRGQNWFQRPFSGQMNQDYDSGNGSDYSTAVAAAAFVIKSLDELSIEDHKRKKRERADPNVSITETKSKTEDTSWVSEAAAKITRRLSGELPLTNTEVRDRRVPIRAATIDNVPEKIVAPVPSVKRTPTYTETRNSNTSVGKKSETVLPKPPKLDLPPPKNSSLPPNEARKQSAVEPPTGKTKADIWEKAEIAKVNDRYEKVKATILEWEKKKKAKARRRMDKLEQELERKRAKALSNYRNDMETIDKIAGGARAQAEENRRKEELKVKEKADKIRLTGETPAASKCLCF